MPDFRIEPEARNAGRASSPFRLEPIQEFHLERVLNWRNSDRVRKFSHNSSLIELSEHRRWFSKLDLDVTPVYIFYEGQVERGVIQLSKIDEVHGTATWGFYMGDAGSARNSLRMGYLGLERFFEEHGARKIYGEVYSDNSVSYKYHSFLGFECEARFNAHRISDGVFRDLYVFGYLVDSWLENKRRLRSLLFRS